MSPIHIILELLLMFGLSWWMGRGVLPWPKRYGYTRPGWYVIRRRGDAPYGPYADRAMALADWGFDIEPVWMDHRS